MFSLAIVHIFYSSVEWREFHAVFIPVSREIRSDVIMAHVPIDGNGRIRWAVGIFMGEEEAICVE